MPIFDHGRETLEVYPPVLENDTFGNEVLRPGDPERDTPVVLTGAIVQPVTADAEMMSGVSLLSIYRVIVGWGKFPWGAKTVVRWDGMLWDVGEPPARRPYSPGTAHVTIYITARGEDQDFNDG